MAHWSHDTHAKLEAAGYRYIGMATCKYPPCTQVVDFYQTPRGKEMPFEPAAYEGRAGDAPNPPLLQPHAATCEGYKARELERKAWRNDVAQARSH